jgi:hypothetical protein
MDQARVVSLEGSSALSSPLACMGDDLFLNQPSSLLFVDSRHPGVEVVDKTQRPAFGASYQWSSVLGGPRISHASEDKRDSAKVFSASTSPKVL